MNLKFSEHVIEADDGTFKVSLTPMVGLGRYVFKYLNTGGNTPEEYFTYSYVEEVYESEHVRTTTKTLRVTLDAKYKEADLHNVVETQCHHLTMTQLNKLLKLLHKLKEFFDGTLGTWIIDVNLKCKEGTKTTC